MLERENLRGISLVHDAEPSFVISHSVSISLRIQGEILLCPSGMH